MWKEYMTLKLSEHFLSMKACSNNKGVIATGRKAVHRNYSTSFFFFFTPQSVCAFWKLLWNCKKWPYAISESLTKTHGAASAVAGESIRCIDANQRTHWTGVFGQNKIIIKMCIYP